MLCTRGMPHLRAGADEMHVIKGPLKGWLCTVSNSLHYAYSFSSNNGAAMQDGQIGQGAEAHRVWDESSGQGKGTKNARQYAIRSR